MESTIRKNILEIPEYTPYCGSLRCKPGISITRWPRTFFNGTQFECAKCGWVSKFPKSFIEKYKTKFKLNDNQIKKT